MAKKTVSLIYVSIMTESMLIYCVDNTTAGNYWLYLYTLKFLLIYTANGKIGGKSWPRLE